MKKYIAGLVMFGMLSSPVIALELKTDVDKLSYSFGHNIGKELKKREAEVNLDIVRTAIADAMAGKSELSADEIGKILNIFHLDYKAKQEKAALEKGKAFLAENAKKEGVVSLPSGLQYKIIKEGTGKSPKATDKVSTHYRGTLISGAEFDSSYKRGKPTSFGVNQVIPGWTEALQLMKVGAKWQLFVPADLAYGNRAVGGLIEPNSTLLFDVELLTIVDDAKK